MSRWSWVSTGEEWGMAQRGAALMRWRCAPRGSGASPSGALRLGVAPCARERDRGSGGAGPGHVREGAVPSPECAPMYGGSRQGRAFDPTIRGSSNRTSHTNRADRTWAGDRLGVNDARILIHLDARKGIHSQRVVRRQRGKKSPACLGSECSLPPWGEANESHTGSGASEGTDRFREPGVFC